jgi:hypothetical protein
MNQNTIPPEREPFGRGRYFQRRPIRPGELPVIMKVHIFTGTLGSVWGTLIAGIIYVYFGNAIGMTQLQWGILGGISSWVVIAQPLGALLGERAGSRKAVWFWTAMADRVLRLAGIVGAYMLWRKGHTAAYLVFMVGVCVGTLVGNLSPGPWFGWLATIIPREIQGTFWGRRDSWISLVVIAVMLPSGFLMDLIPQGGKLETATLILAAVSVFGYVDILIHGTIPEPPLKENVPRRALAGIFSPLRDKQFRPWLRFAASWNFSMGLGGALCFLYFMDNLGFRNNLLGGMFAINVVGLVGTLVAARGVGRMVDRLGIKRMLLLGHLFWSMLPAIWLFATPRTALFWIGLASLVGGIFPSAANNAAVKLATRFPAPEESGMYMAVSTMVGSFAGGLGSVVAGGFLHVMGGWSVTFLGLTVSPFPMLFIASFILRLVTTLTLIPRIRVTGALPDEERPFLLPLFFESVPGINRIMRAQRRERGSAPRGRRRPPRDTDQTDH